MGDILPGKLLLAHATIQSGGYHYFLQVGARQLQRHLDNPARHIVTGHSSKWRAAGLDPLSHGEVPGQHDHGPSCSEQKPHHAPSAEPTGVVAEPDSLRINEEQQPGTEAQPRKVWDDRSYPELRHDADEPGESGTDDESQQWMQRSTFPDA